jgi:phage terminase small subunit
MEQSILTAKQEAFARFMSGGASQADAYRAAYNAKDMKAETIHKRASELMANGVVAGRVAELREELANKSLWTREQSVAVLSAVVADNAAKHNDRISAVKVLNDMQGFNAPTKHEVEAKVNISVHFD